MYYVPLKVNTAVPTGNSIWVEGASAGDHGGPAPKPPAQAAPREQAGMGHQAVAAACGPRQARGAGLPRVAG